MAASPISRRRVELILVPTLAALCVAFILAAVAMDRDGVACPPNSWHNELTLTLAGDRGSVEQAGAVTACSGADCIPLTPGFARSTGGGANLLALQNDGSWRLDVGAEEPGSLTFRVFDTAGVLMAQQSTALNWTRVGGSDVCGGPMAELSVAVQLP